MGDSGDGIDCLEGYGGPLESVTGVAGPVLLAATVPDLARGDVLAGRYQIEAVIGSGGSGRVLRAFDRVTRTAVALKILRSEYAADPVWNERFSRELRVGRQIQHPNVCRVYDIGDSDGHKFLSMELATGGTIRSQLAPGAAPRSVDDRIADARAIIQGVAALHAAGIVHRDLKPENILRAADGRLLVSDFGLATDPGAGPATTIMIGTPRYMAPEVVMGDPATIRSDVWALGVVMHEILSGERPNRSLIKRRRRMYTPPEVGSPRERRLVELCARCSEEDPEERPASAIELRREFEAAVSGRRIGSRSFKKQIAWAAVAAVALASLGLVRNYWTSNAIASSSQALPSGGGHPVTIAGTPTNWGTSASSVASFAGTIHCLSLLPGETTVQAIWGVPKRSEIVDLATGKREPASLLPATYADGCPQVSPDGQQLLFSKATSNGSHVFLSESPDGRGAHQLVRGSVPKWLPNGQEFVFSVDSRTAAIFATATGEMTLVNDGDTAGRQLGEYAVDRTGSHLAIRYVSGTKESVVVVHSLPSLEVIRRVRIPAFSRYLRFGPTSESLLFAFDGPDGYLQLDSIDTRDGTVRSIGNLPNSNLTEALLFDTQQVVFASHERRTDLWAFEGGNPVRLTEDGSSFHGDLSKTNDLVIQRRLPTGEMVIVLKRADGATERLSDGPTDVTPEFLPDGAVVFGRLSDGTLQVCEPGHRCKTLYKDALVPGFPAASPSGDQVAYLTLMNSPRVRVIHRSGQLSRDLGPAGGDSCPPYWTSNTRLWVAGRAESSALPWVEFDVPTGRRTGATQVVTLGAGQDCEPPVVPSAKDDGRPSFVVPIARDRSELLRRPRQALAQK